GCFLPGKAIAVGAALRRVVSLDLEPTKMGRLVNCLAVAGIDGHLLHNGVDLSLVPSLGISTRRSPLGTTAVIPLPGLSLPGHCLDLALLSSRAVQFTAHHNLVRSNQATCGAGLVE